LIARRGNRGADSAAEGTVLAYQLAKGSSQGRKRQIKIKEVDNTILLSNVLQEERSWRKSMILE